MKASPILVFLLFLSLLTAKASAEDRITGLHTGAVDYLTRPFDSTELKARIANLLSFRAGLQRHSEGKNLLKLSEVELQE